MTALPTGRPSAALLLAISLMTGAAVAAPFTPGNVVVYRIGNGSVSLGANGHPVFLDEYTPAGSKVQSIALPTSASGAQKALVGSGTATQDGLLTRSADGNCLLVPGYARDLGTGSGNLVSGTVAGGGAIPRVVGRVTGLGVTDTSTALTDAMIAGNIRSATSTDCTGAWVSGSGTGGSLRYATIGSTTSADVTGASIANTRQVSISGAQLYTSASVTTLKTVAAVGTGTPTSGPQTATQLPGLPLSTSTAQPFGFFFARLNPASANADTLYIADEASGIQKWTLSGTTWVASGTVGTGTDVYRAVTGTMGNGTVTLFATRGTTGAGGGQLVSIVDASGYSGTLVATPTILATAAANTVFRGVAPTPGTVTQVPSYTVTPSADANGAISPITPQAVFSGSTVTFTVTPSFGYMAAVGGSCGGELSGSQYITHAVTADCTVVAGFVPLPRYTVTPSAGPNGTISPAAPLDVMQGETASFNVTPAVGYNAAVRGSCGGSFVGDTYVTKPITGPCTVTVVFAKKLVLFVGNSYTFGRVDPVMSYNTANVTDLTYEMWIANPNGSNDDEPHPWGGIPGVFKKMTDQAGLDYDVSISARNAASLRGHYLNSNPAGWDLRGNVASQRWDVVMLQDLSDEPLPAGRSANANLPYFNAYVDKLEAWVHNGAAETYTETQLFGGTTDACRAITGASASACDTVRTIPSPNPHARNAADVYLYETWARPDMIGPNGTDVDGIFYSAAEGLEAMTADFHNAYFQRAAANGRIEDVSPVGDAFLRAVVDGVAMRDPYVPEAGKVDLWHTDYFHPSKYGSYLSAAVHFMTITGINPLTLGPGEQAAQDLGIAPEIAKQLQRVAQAVVSPDTVAPVTVATLSAQPNGAGWYAANVTLFLAATDTGGAGLDFVSYSLGGAQAGSGTFPASGSVTISAEGVTTITYYAVDRAGNVEVARTIQVAIDKTAPVIAGMPSAACSLWPPNLKMVTVATVTASDATSGIASFGVAASSNQAPIVPGQVDTSVTGSGSARVVSLRAARSGSDARVYTVTATATDAAGNSAQATATCTVPLAQN